MEPLSLIRKLIVAAGLLVAVLGCLLGVHEFIRYRQKSAHLDALRQHASCFHESNPGSGLIEELCWRIRQDVPAETRLLADCAGSIHWNRLVLTVESQVTSADVTVLCHIERLTSLTIHGIRHDALTALETCEGLEELYFSSSVRGELFSEMPVMQSLNAFGAENARNVDELVEHLCRCAPRLRWINLSRTDLSDVGVERLSCMTELEHLYIDDTNVTCGGFAALAKLEELSFVSARRVEVADECLGAIGIAFEVRIK